MKHLILAVFAVSSLSIASGWLCESTSRNTSPYTFRVKLYNYTDATRLPKIFVVSEKNLGTLLRSEDESIQKDIMGLETIYTSRARQSEPLSKDLGLEIAEFSIPYREGVDKPLKNGAILKGELALQGEEGTTIVSLRCARYLKNNF